MHHSDPNHNEETPSEETNSELRDAERTANVLASSDLTNVDSDEDADTARLGAAIRRSAAAALPAPSESLRTAVLQRLESHEPLRPELQSLAKGSSVAKNARRRAWRRSVAVIAVTAAGLLIALSVMELPTQRASLATKPSPAVGEPTGGQPVASIPPIVKRINPDAEPVPTTAAAKPKFRTETRTRQVPVTRMRTETQTRAVPMTRMRTETRTRQVPITTMTPQNKTKTITVNGKEQQQSYTVNVPETTMHTETYSVQVPYTEQVSQSYTVQVPYTDQITQTYTVQVPIDSGRSDQYTVSVPHGAWGTQINRQSLEAFPAPKLPGINSRAERLVDTGTSGEQYDALGENQFVKVKNAPRSTFSIDVDTASYTNTRRFLNNGQLPPPNAVRIEEFLNYFDYDYPQPKDGSPFSVNMEVAQCPWNSDNKLLRIGLKGKKIQRDKRPASNLVFLLDVSGSMKSADKLPLMKQGLSMMVRQLREDDFVSIVTYAGHAGVVLPPTSGDQTDVINSAIESLNSGGSTNGSAGIDLAYELAAQHFVKDGTNRVILATDGDLNVGITDDNALTKLIQSKAGEGVFLTVLGFGTGNLKDAKMEKLADNGNGNYAYIDCTREAQKVLVREMSQNLVTIAKDVKLQLEFNPKHVDSYRLVGYENRALADKDFADDKKDAGEIGAGHTVTALYELVTATGNKRVKDAKQNAKPPELKYQDAVASEPAKRKKLKLSDAAKTDELLTLSLRHKQPDSDESAKTEYVCKTADTKFSDASDDFRFAASVASFGMLLRQSKHAGPTTLTDIGQTASDTLGEDPSGDRAELLDLIRKANELLK